MVNTSTNPKAYFCMHDKVNCLCMKGKCICKQGKLFKYLWTSLKGEVLENMAWLLAFTCLLIPQTDGPPPALVPPPPPPPAYCLVVLRGSRGKRGGGRGASSDLLQEPSIWQSIIFLHPLLVQPIAVTLPGHDSAISCQNFSSWSLCLWTKSNWISIPHSQLQMVDWDQQQTSDMPPVILVTTLMCEFCQIFNRAK
jgi:hypothetical protein